MILRLSTLIFLLFLLSACQTGQTPQTNSGNQAPQASFTASASTGQAPLSISFDASASTDSDGGITEFNWNFGDGNTASGQIVSHSFQQAGSFTVSLSIKDNQGASASASQQITVTDPNNPSNPTDPNPTNPTNPNNSEETILSSAWDASLNAIAAPTEFTELAVSAVLIASEQAGTGNLIGTGTLTETATNVFSYQATPNDKLIVKRLNGAELEFVFTDLRGDFSNEGRNYLSQDHSAIFQITGNEIVGNLNASIRDIQLPRENSRVRDTLESISGSFTDANNTTWTANLTTQGAELSDVDSAGLESESQTQGSLTANSLGLNMTIARSNRFKTINLVFDSGQQVADTWQLGNDSFQMNNVQTRTIFRETQEVDLDQWIIQGNLTKNGTVIGQVQEDTSDPARVLIALFVGDTKLNLVSISRF